MTFDELLGALAAYGHGDVFEAHGYSALSRDARAALGHRIVDDSLRAGYAVAGSLDAGWMDLIGDRSSGWPDVRLERSDEDRLVVFVAQTNGRAASGVHLVVRALRRAALELAPIPKQ